MKLSPEQLEIVLASRIGKILGEYGALAFIEAGELRRKSKSGTLFREGDPGAGFFFILSGSIKLLRIGRDGREMVLHVAGPSSIIAEAAIFIGRYPATAIAQADTELIFLSKTSALDLIEKSGPFARFMMDGMALWLKKMVSKIEQLTISDATARLSRYLLDLLERTTPKVSPTPPKISLPVKKGELALLLNMQQPSLSRIFRKMQDDGLIAVRGSSVQLLDVAALRRSTLPPLD